MSHTEATSLPPQRADRYVSNRDGRTVASPLRTTVESLVATVTEALSDQAHQLIALGGDVVRVEDWELASWTAKPDLADPEGRWRFTAEYVWMPRLATPGES